MAAGTHSEVNPVRLARLAGMVPLRELFPMDLRKQRERVDQL